jgi:ABC-type transporter Mla subunit MlaD
MVGDDMADKKASDSLAQAQKKDALKSKLAHLEELASKVKNEFSSIETQNEANQKVSATLSAVVGREKEKIRKLLADDLPQKKPAEKAAEPSLTKVETTKPAATQEAKPKAIKAEPVAQKPEPIAKPEIAAKTEPIQPVVQE